MRSANIKKMVTTAALLAVGWLLPFLTGQIPAIGSMLSPLHIPVFLCGLTCGPVWGALLGFILPLTRSMIFGMPPIFPVATAMAFEMAAYGLLSGVLVSVFAKLLKNSGHTAAIYAALICAMLGGRVVWGIADWVCIGINGGAFTFTAFLAGAFINAWPGILLHLIIIPPIALALEKARVAPNLTACRAM